MKRRTFVKRAIAAGATAGLAPLSSSCGRGGSSDQSSSKAEKIRIGFIPLTDCSSVVMAHELGLYKRAGLDVEVSREASWANVRDKLLTGELDAAHCLFGMPFSVHTGIGGAVGQEMFIAMVLNNNGQAITLSKELCSIGYGDTAKVSGGVEMLKAKKKEVTFAMTFPGGTHDVWLRYWLKAAGVDQKSVKIITIPPPQMVANMKVGNMDGFCVGEPWNGVAVKQEIGFTHITTQDIWKHHPEKALVASKEFAIRRRGDLKAVMRAVLEASIWLDDLKNRAQAAEIIGRQSYVNAPADVIGERLLGRYDLGCDQASREFKDDYMTFHNNGFVNLPRKSHGIWYLAQYVRHGYLTSPPDYQKIVDRLILQDLYLEVAKETGVNVPADDMKPFTVDLDKIAFDPNNPAEAAAAGEW